MKKSLPELTYLGNEQKKLTLHIFFQIMGKIRMKLTPRKNHWWYITLYVNEYGFTTGPIPINDDFDSFSITLNVLKHRLEVSTSEGKYDYFEFKAGLSVASFYREIFTILKKQNIKVEIYQKPFDLNIDRKCSEIEDINSYDQKYVENYWRTFLWISQVFKEFSGRFYGKTCPVHLYWHSMDLAVTRFSGKKAAKTPPESRLSDKDAYSHECISFGFWAGDENLKEPAFYSYTFPSPNGLEQEAILPKSANWVMNNGSAMAVLKYSDLKKEQEPKKALLEFLESAYLGGAKLAGWEIEKLKVPSLGEL